MRNTIAALVALFLGPLNWSLAAQAQEAVHFP